LDDLRIAEDDPTGARRPAQWIAAARQILDECRRAGRELLVRFYLNDEEKGQIVGNFAYRTSTSIA